MTALTDRDRAILEFERRTTGLLAGDKETLARQTFEVSSTRYYQILNTLLDQPAATEYDPELVGRLRRLREQRRAARNPTRA